MENRLNLDNKLREILGSTNVYYQPPESVKISYPCIIYELSDIPTEKADNSLYIINYRYTVTLIHRKEASELRDRLLLGLQPYCSLNKIYTADNLYHYVFDVYY